MINCMTVHGTDNTKKKVSPPTLGQSLLQRLQIGPSIRQPHVWTDNVHWPSMLVTVYMCVLSRHVLFYTSLSTIAKEIESSLGYGCSAYCG